MVCRNVNNYSTLVSVIIPVYNAEFYLKETIKTVQQQTYTNWELIFVDDLSTDNSVKIILEHQICEPRIMIIKNDINSFAAITRNNGIERANGRYIAFLDADDLWEPTKLEKQLIFMKQKDCAFSFTGYEFADKDGIPNSKKVNVPSKIAYRQALKNTTIWTSTVIFDLEKISKVNIQMPNLKRGQDTATWWKVLRSINFAYGMNEIMSYYRRTDTSLSSNKLVALNRTWNLYRNIENLSILNSAYYFTWYCFNATRRRI